MVAALELTGETRVVYQVMQRQYSSAEAFFAELKKRRFRGLQHFFDAMDNADFEATPEYVGIVVRLMEEAGYRHLATTDRALMDRGGTSIPARRTLGQIRSNYTVTGPSGQREVGVAYSDVFVTPAMIGGRVKPERADVYAKS